VSEFLASLMGPSGRAPEHMFSFLYQEDKVELTTFNGKETLLSLWMSYLLFAGLC